MTTKILLLLTSLAVAEECQQADFEEPQPVGAKNLKVIPARLRGTYMKEGDSTLLEISEKVILKHDSEQGTVSRNELRKDSVVWSEITHDTIVCEGGLCLDIKPFGDSLRFKMNTVDTLIHISDSGNDGVMRKSGEYYFLNKKKHSGKWNVKKVELNKKELTISSTYADKDIAYLREQLKTSDSTLIFNPTKTQFNQFVKEGGFRNSEKFRKQ